MPHLFSYKTQAKALRRHRRGLMGALLSLRAPGGHTKGSYHSGMLSRVVNRRGRGRGGRRGRGASDRALRGRVLFVPRG